MFNSKPSIILTCGIPGSGKSTWSSQFIKNNPDYIYLCADIMRGVIGEDESDQKVNKDVFYILHNIENYFAKLGRNMLIDETNYKKSRRAFYINLAKKYNYDVNCVVFTTDLNTCLVRNANRERRVPVGIIEKHHNEFEPPAKEEGFDIIINSEDYVFAYEDLHKMFNEAYKFEESITDIIIKNFDDMV